MPRRQLISSACCAATLLSVAGCPAPPTGNSTPLPPGTYEGTVGSTTRVFVDGVEQGTPIQDSSTIRETIAASGYPVLSTGEPVQTGDAIILAQAGDNELVGTVASIVEGADTLILNMNLDGTIDGVAVTGTGQTVYTVQADGRIGFDLSLDWSGTDPGGQVIRQTETREGVLVPVN